MSNFLDGTEFLNPEDLWTRRDDILRHHRIYLLKNLDTYNSIISYSDNPIPSNEVKQWRQDLLDLVPTAFKYENIPAEIKAKFNRIELERIDDEFYTRLKF